LGRTPPTGRISADLGSDKDSCEGDEAAAMPLLPSVLATAEALAGVAAGGGATPSVCDKGYVRGWAARLENGLLLAPLATTVKPEAAGLFAGV
jgi:hypothetical protein